MRGLRLWAERAWLPGGWRDDVLLEADAGGRWSRIEAGVPCPDGAEVAAGALLPGLVDAHSHAFQRAFAGLAEQRATDADDFWSWRDRMYRVALRITPVQLRAIATQLQIELLAGGYTQLCEFHYLHHDVDGRPHDDPLAMAWAIADAAADTGIGLTLLPVLYERAGFTRPALREDQRRFRSDAAFVHAAQRRLAAAGRPLLSAGVALHSLRAAAPASIRALCRLVGDEALPIHIHVAEQTAEVDDCLAVTGRRPIDWLAAEGLLDPRWQLVHATHTTPAEIDAVARSGAAAVICPSTEGNLGDGFCDLPRWLASGAPLSIGSDSHVGRDALEELRWLEYGQRLRERRRNVAAQPASGQPATAAVLFDAVVAGGARACGEARWGLVVGARADALVADPAGDALLGVPPQRTLDALVFATPSRPWRDVLVAGRWVIRSHVHPRRAAAAQAFTQAMHELHADG